MLNCDYYLQGKMCDQYVYIKLYKYGDQFLLGFSECEKVVLQIDTFWLAFRRRPFLEPIADKIVEPII